MASVAKATTRKRPASTGARVAMPPMRESSSLPPARRANAPMIRNSAPTTRPWFSRGKGDHRAVQDRPHRHDDHQLLEVVGGAGHRGQDDPKEAVGAHLRE